MCVTVGEVKFLRQLFDIFKARENEIYRPRFLLLLVVKYILYILHIRCNTEETSSVKAVTLALCSITHHDSNLW